MAKSDSQKKLEGTARKDRKKGVKGDANTLPKVPTGFGLSVVGRRYYRLIGGHLLKYQVLSNIDAFALAMFCQNIDFYLTAKHQINVEGMVQVYKSGASNVTGSVSAYSVFYKLVMEGVKTFGCTPYHRERIMSFVMSEDIANNTDAAFEKALSELGISMN